MNIKNQGNIPSCNETTYTLLSFHYGPAPIANIIRNSACIIAIVTLLKMIGIVPKPVRSFMKPLIAHINPMMDKTTDPTSNVRELDGSVNTL